MPGRKVLTLVAGCFLACIPHSAAQASPGFGSNLGLRASVTVKPRSGPFQVPAKLRPRVDFWKDVFAKYGRNQVVIHHREFPQIVFGVMDFAAEAQTMSPVELSRHRASVERSTLAALKRQIEPLARGEGPSTAIQQKIARLMAFLPGGTSKYQRLLDEDLIRTQTGIRERYAEAIRRSWRYLPVMEQIFVSEYGLPKELTRIPFIESSFDYTAYSSVGAAGIWQFMPRTARAHRMAVGRYIDERRDPIKATRAAAEYLRSAYNSLGAWPLAITSYNHGVGGVRSKVSKAGTMDLVDIIEDPNERYFGFASTNFFPEFLAALEIFDEHERYFPEVRVEPPLRVVSYPLPGSTSVGYITRQLGISEEELREANYAILDPVWRGAARIPAGYVLRVPVEYQQRLEQLGIREEPSRPSGGVQMVSTSTVYGGATYRVRKGDTLGSIAKRYGTTPNRLMGLNGLRSSAVKVGQTLVVREPDHSKRPAGTLDAAASKEASVIKKPSRSNATTAKPKAAVSKPSKSGKTSKPSKATQRSSAPSKAAKSGRTAKKTSASGKSQR